MSQSLRQYLAHLFLKGMTKRMAYLMPLTLSFIHLDYTFLKK